MHEDINKEMGVGAVSADLELDASYLNIGLIRVIAFDLALLCRRPGAAPGGHQ